MFATGLEGSTEWGLLAGIFFLGCILSPITESLIARRLPRLGGLPTLPIRITTAAITGALCFAFSLRFGFESYLSAFILMAVLSVQLARIDIALHLLPNPLVLLLVSGGLFLFLVSSLFGEQSVSMLRALLGALILFVGYLILGLISPGGIGMGDVKLAAPVGLYLGYLGWTQLLYGGLLGFILNGVVTVVAIGRKGRKSTAEVAHGPTMLGALSAVTLFMS